MGKRNQRREGEEEGAHLTLATTAGTARCSDEGVGDVGASSRRKPDVALAAARCTHHSADAQWPRETARRALGASGRENGARGVEMGE
jgi:hypothetical protein